MFQFDYTYQDVKLQCTLTDSIAVTGVRGSGSGIVIPAVMEAQGKEYPVRVIGKKAFLGCRWLRSIILPETIEQIEDWAFAQCDHLERICVKRDERNDTLTLGMGVFDSCNHLENLQLKGENGDSDYGLLLGACVNKLTAEDLLRDEDAGNLHWYEKWDLRLSTFLQEDDSEGYQTLVLCGEEDIQRDLPGFILDKQKLKASLCMLRLLHDNHLQFEMRGQYEAYLISHMKGCESQAAWETIMSDYGDRLEYYELMAAIGGIHKDNIDGMIEDLGGNYPESKAYLIRYKQDHMEVDDVFAAFEL